MLGVAQCIRRRDRCRSRADRGSGVPRDGESRAALRNRIYRESGIRIEVPASDLPSARTSVEHGFIHGSPATVAEAITEIAALGIGGVIATFRLGPLPHEAATSSLTLFMQQVAPRFRGSIEKV